VRVELTSPILILLLLTFRLYVAGMGRSLRGDGGGEISSKSAMGVEGTFHLFRLESGKQRRQQDQAAVPGGLGGGGGSCGRVPLPRPFGRSTAACLFHLFLGSKLTALILFLIGISHMLKVASIVPNPSMHLFVTKFHTYLHCHGSCEWTR
jgi:hypothetical protein